MPDTRYRSRFIEQASQHEDGLPLWLPGEEQTAAEAVQTVEAAQRQIPETSAALRRAAALS